MWLDNLQLRVRKTELGYTVETKKYYKYFPFVGYWIHIEGVSGMSKVPWYFGTKEDAIGIATKHFEWDLTMNSE